RHLTRALEAVAEREPAPQREPIVASAHAMRGPTRLQLGLIEAGHGRRRWMPGAQPARQRNAEAFLRTVQNAVRQPVAQCTLEDPLGRAPAQLHLPGQ